MGKPTTQTILIATTNPGKFKELVFEFADLPFTFVNLTDCGLDTMPVDEPYNTTEQNAIHKARSYGKKSGLLTIAEDSGFFIDFLNGAPGAEVKLVAKTPEQRVQKILQDLAGVPTKKRTAYFETTACVYNPQTDSYSTFVGRAPGVIAQSITSGARPGMEYDSIFYYAGHKKIGALLTPQEKNLVSHRGKVASQIKVHLMRQFSFIQFIVPTAIIIKGDTLFLNRRRDHRPALNNKWEFPGGGVDNGESPVTCLKREVKEETGFTVEPIELLPYIFSTVSKGISNEAYQIFLLCYICKIKSGTLKVPPAESNGHGWFTLAQAKKMDFLSLNKELFRRPDCISIIKKYID